MRHYIAARPVTTRSLGMGEPPSAAGLVAPSGGVLLVAPRSLRAVAGAVDLASVATAADHSLGATVRAKKQSSRRRVTVFGPANAKWTDATIARIMPCMRAQHGVGTASRRNSQVGLGAGSNRDAVVGLPDRAQFEVENDLARVLPSRLVAAGVEIEDPWLDPELLGDNVDDRDR